MESHLAKLSLGNFSRTSPHNYILGIRTQAVFADYRFQIKERRTLNWSLDSESVSDFSSSTSDSETPDSNSDTLLVLSKHNSNHTRITCL